jgi:hypothetical protein
MARILHSAVSDVPMSPAGGTLLSPELFVRAVEPRPFRATRRHLAPLVWVLLSEKQPIPAAKFLLNFVSHRRPTMTELMDVDAPHLLELQGRYGLVPKAARDIVDTRAWSAAWEASEHFRRRKEVEAKKHAEA